MSAVRWAPVLGAGLLVLGVAGVGAGVWYWQALDRVWADMRDRQGRVDARLDGLAAGFQDAERRLDERLGARVETLGRRYQTLQDSLDALYQNPGRDALGWMLAETEYLLLVAGQRLALERSPASAARALEAADERLRLLGDPRLIPVRERIAAYLAELRAMDVPDVTGIALALGDIAGRVDALPLHVPGGSAPASAEPARRHPPESADDGNDGERLLRAMWSNLRGLVVVRRADGQRGPALAPDESVFLRHNLRLQLEGARVAALRHDTANFQLGVRTAADWLARYFDPADPAVSAAGAALGGYAALELNPDFPEVSGAVDMLRRIGQGTPSAAAQEAGG